MLLADEKGEIRESYAVDEFGQSLHNSPEGQLQPFGYTGYQMETAGGLYFAQARRYDAGAGRFVSEDRIPGFAALPHTMNHYSYCWNQPMEHVDLDGRLPYYFLSNTLYDELTLWDRCFGSSDVGEGVADYGEEHKVTGYKKSEACIDQ